MPNAPSELAGSRRGAEVREQLRELGARGPQHLVELAGLELRHERPQRARDRRVRQLALAELDAVADEHERAAGLGLGRELGDEPALADARLAGDEHGRRATLRRALDGGAQHRHLGLARDQGVPFQDSGLGWTRYLPSRTASTASRPGVNAASWPSQISVIAQ